MVAELVDWAHFLYSNIWYVYKILITMYIKCKYTPNHLLKSGAAGKLI